MAERKQGDGWDEYYHLRAQVEAAKADEMRRLNDWCEDLAKGQKEIGDKVSRIDVAIARLEEAAKKNGGIGHSPVVAAPARFSPDAGFYSGLASLLVAVATALWVLIGKGRLP